MPSLKQKVLGIIAGGLTIASLSGIPSYASHKNPRDIFMENNSIAFGDVENDGLEDMIIGSSSTVKYFKNIGNGIFEFKQLIYSSEKKAKIDVTLIRDKGELYLVFMSPFEFRMYKDNNGKFEEVKDDVMWVEEE